MPAAAVQQQGTGPEGLAAEKAGQGAWHSLAIWRGQRQDVCCDRQHSPGGQGPYCDTYLADEPNQHWWSQGVPALHRVSRSTEHTRRHVRSV